MLLKVSSMAMYKPLSQNIKNISPFHHIDVLSALYTHVLSYSVQASLSFHHLINFCSIAGVICHFVDFAAVIKISSNNNEWE